MDALLIKKVRDITRDMKESSIEAGEKILDEYLLQNPQDIEAWLRLACLILTPPIVDVNKSIACVNTALTYEPDNADALLMLALINSVHFGQITEDLFNKLDNLKVEDRQYRSMILYAQAWRYWLHEDLSYEQLLIKSIEACGCHVFNYKHLAYYYFKHGQKEKAKHLIKTAFHNIQAIYFEDIDIADPSSYKEYFNIHIKGIHITRILADSIKEKLEKYSLS